MKKFYFLAAAALALASCTNEESIFDAQPTQEIGFKAVATNSSRAAVESTAQWQAPLYVASAYQAGSGDYSDHFGCDFVTFTHNNNDIWTSEATTYYYPINGTIDFIAYSTGTPNADPLLSDQVLPTATITRGGTDKGFSNLQLDYSEKKLQGKTDVMYALAPGITCPNVGPVALKFKHTLAWLSIQMQNTENRTVYIKSVKANDVYLTGVLDIPVNNHVLGTPSWTTNDADKQAAVDFPSYCPPTPTLVNSLITSPEGILIVPGVQTKLTLVYQLTYGVDITYEIDLTGQGTWEAGKHYTYTISFDTMNAITFECQVDNYGNPDQTPETIKP